MDRLLREREEEQFRDAAERLREALENTPQLKLLAKSLIIDNTPEGLRIQIHDQDGLAMFPRGSTEMYLHTRRLLEMIADVIMQMPQQVAITGHTDATPYVRDNGYGNWELAADRANAARRVILTYGVPETRVSRVVGKAAIEPLIVDEPGAPADEQGVQSAGPGASADEPGAPADELDGPVNERDGPVGDPAPRAPDAGAAPATPAAVPTISPACGQPRSLSPMKHTTVAPAATAAPQGGLGIATLTPRSGRGGGVSARRQRAAGGGAPRGAGPGGGGRVPRRVGGAGGGAGRVWRGGPRGPPVACPRRASASPQA